MLKRRENRRLYEVFEFRELLEKGLMMRKGVQGDFTCRVVYKVRGLLTCLRLGGM